MPDWNLDLPFDTEPTHVPTGDECEHAARGENCGRTDCQDCGREAAATLRAAATASFPMLVLLAAEAAHQQEKYGSNVPETAVVLGDVACSLMLWRAWNPTPHMITHSMCFAWSEGLVDATCDAPMPHTAREFFTTDYERWCYFLGRVAPALHRLHAHLRNREVQAMADAGISFAAGATSASSAIPARGHGQPTQLGPGFEFRAQHRGHSSAERRKT